MISVCYKLLQFVISKYLHLARERRRSDLDILEKGSPLAAVGVDCVKHNLHLIH